MAQAERRVRLAAGRLSSSDAEQFLMFQAGANSIFNGDKLLTTDNPERAYALAAYVDELNKNRKTVERRITKEAKELVEQHPDLVDLPLVVVANGWDNVILRLGRDLSVRVPRRQAAARLVANEQRWLPELAPRLGITETAAARLRPLPA